MNSISNGLFGGYIFKRVFSNWNSGTSFLAYNVGPSLERELTLSLRVKTLYTSGTLLHSFGQFDYALLEVSKKIGNFSILFLLMQTRW